MKKVINFIIKMLIAIYLLLVIMHMILDFFKTDIDYTLYYRNNLKILYIILTAVFGFGLLLKIYNDWFSDSKKIFIKSMIDILSDIFILAVLLFTNIFVVYMVFDIYKSKVPMSIIENIKNSIAKQNIIENILLIFSPFAMMILLYTNINVLIKKIRKIKIKYFDSRVT